MAYVGPEGEALVTLDVARGTNVAAAAAQSGVFARIDAPRETLAYAIFGRRVEPGTIVAAGDRVEITRPLACDPKLARRRRAARG